MRAIDPAVKVLVVSGFPDGADVAELIEHGAHFLAKPYSLKQLETQLCALDASATRRGPESIPE